MATFMIVAPVSVSIGGPLGGSLLALDGQLGLRGWQWLFLIEGLPSVLLGLAVLVYLTDNPEEAQWLSKEQRDWLVDRMRRDREGRAAPTDLNPLRVLVNPVLWLLALAYMLYVTIGTPWFFWGPTVVRDAVHTNDTITGWIWGAAGVLSALTGLVAGATSDRTGDRFLHATAGAGLMAVGFAGAALLPAPWGPVAGLVVVGIGMRMFMPTFWCIPTIALSGSAAAAGIGLINSVGSIGAFAGTWVVGVFKDLTGGTAGVFLGFAALALCTSAVLLVARRQKVFAPRARAAVAFPTGDKAMADVRS